MGKFGIKEAMLAKRMTSLMRGDRYVKEDFKLLTAN